MIRNIQILRAFAALNVVAYHIIATSKNYDNEVIFFILLEGWGACGVDIFFVISGFVMVYAQTLNPKSAIIFLKNRIIRIVPIYWLLTIFIFFLSIIIPTLFNSNDVSINHLLTSMTFSSLLVQNQTPLLYLGWTLEYEMIFYCIFMLGIILNRSLTISNIIITLFIISIIIVSNYNHLIMIEFIFGIFCAQLYLNSEKSKYGLIFLIFGILLLSSSLLLDFENINLAQSRVIIWGIPSLLIVYGLINLEQ